MMLKNTLIFVGGVLVGSISTYFIVKDKFESKADEEIESVKSSLAKQYEESKKKAEAAVNKPPIGEIVKEKGYSINDYVEAIKEAAESVQVTASIVEEPKVEPNIRLLTQRAFVDNARGYAQVDFFYYADGVLADDINQEISNPADYLGANYHEVLERATEDAVYFSNNEMEMDIAVAKKYITFEEELEDSPPY